MAVTFKVTDGEWTATKNGKPVEIKVVDGGMMAVKVDGKENNIVFKYVTPGLRYGLLISGVSMLILIGYVFICKKKKSF